MHSPVLERIFARPTVSSQRTEEGSEWLGRASVQLVDDVCSRIATQQSRSEARLADLIEKLAAEEERGRRLEEQINRADNAAVEAELWVTCLTDAIKTQIMSRDTQGKRAIATE